MTKNVYRQQDSILTNTAISQQTRSQSTTTNSEKFHYKITETIPYQPVPNGQLISTLVNTFIPPYPAPYQPVLGPNGPSVSTSTIGSMYIPPYPPTRSPFHLNPERHGPSVSTSTVGNTYIPPYPTRTPYNFPPTPATKQVFTYPLVNNLALLFVFFVIQTLVHALYHNNLISLHILNCYFSNDIDTVTG